MHHATCSAGSKQSTAFQRCYGTWLLASEIGWWYCTWFTAGLIFAPGMNVSIFSGLKLLTPMLLIKPSSTHFSKASQVSENGGVTLGPGFTEVGLHNMAPHESPTHKASCLNTMGSLFEDFSCNKTLLLVQISNQCSLLCSLLGKQDFDICLREIHESSEATQRRFLASQIVLPRPAVQVPDGSKVSPSENSLIARDALGLPSACTAGQGSYLCTQFLNVFWAIRTLSCLVQSLLEDIKLC